MAGGVLTRPKAGEGSVNGACRRDHAVLYAVRRSGAAKFWEERGRTDRPSGMTSKESTMTDALATERQGFHLVDPSPLPIIGAAFAFLTSFCLVLTMRDSRFAVVRPGRL